MAVVIRAVRRLCGVEAVALPILFLHPLRTFAAASLLLCFSRYNLFAGMRDARDWGENGKGRARGCLAD
jgi:hypothetical protein